MVKNYLKENNIALPENSILNIVFVGKTKMKQLALKYKKENEPLPVLTFPLNEDTQEGKILGEIIICYPSAVLLAAEREKTVDKIIKFLIEHALDVLFKI